MCENNIIKICNVQLTRNMKVDYKSGNPVINSVFKKYDIDQNGSLDETEWKKVEEDYQKIETRKQKILNLNNDVLQHYNKKINNLNTKILELNNEFSNMPKDFEKMIEFERNHPGVTRIGVKNKKEIPSGAMKYNISAFEMGIIDDKSENFTGEIYQDGYIAGLDTLNENERQEYLSLLDKAVLNCKKGKNIQKQIEKYEKEIDKYLGLKDLAQNGLLDKIPSGDEEEQIYQNYDMVRNQANPFLAEIQQIEAQYNNLSKKINLNEEDYKRLEQYKIQLDQLKYASNAWSFRDLPDNQKSQIYQGFRVTDASEQLTYKKNGTEEEYSDTHQTGLSFNNENLNLRTNYTETDIYKPNKPSEHSHNFSASGTYQKGQWGVSSNINFNINNQSSNFQEQVGIVHNGMKLSYTRNDMSINQEALNENNELIKTKNSTHSDEVEISAKTGKFENKASIKFAKEGTTWNASTNANFGLKPTDGLNITLMPSFETSYNYNNETTTLNPSLNTMAFYNNQNFGANIMMMENYSTTLSQSHKSQNINNFSLNGGITFKGFGANLKYNDMNSDFMHMNTYGAEISYNNNKYGRLAVEYDYQTTKTQMPQMSSFETANTLNVKYSLPVETINSWFKKH